MTKEETDVVAHQLADLISSANAGGYINRTASYLFATDILHRIHKMSLNGETTTEIQESTIHGKGVTLKSETLFYKWRYGADDISMEDVHVRYKLRITEVQDSKSPIFLN